MKTTKTTEARKAGGGRGGGGAGLEQGGWRASLDQAGTEKGLTTPGTGHAEGSRQGGNSSTKAGEGEQAICERARRGRAPGEGGRAGAWGAEHLVWILLGSLL